MHGTRIAPALSAKRRGGSSSVVPAPIEIQCFAPQATPAPTNWRLRARYDPNVRSIVFILELAPGIAGGTSHCWEVIATKREGPRYETEHRNAPRPVNFKRSLPARLKHDPQVIKWAQRLAGNAHMRPKDLSEEQLAFVMLEVAKRRGDELDRDLFLKAMAETTPALAAPKLERQRLAEDLELIWSQPEMRTFWDGWDGARAKRALLRTTPPGAGWRSCWE